MEKQRTIYATIRIDYTCDENENYDSDLVALDLAICPNYDEKVNGVLIEDVEICDVTDDNDN